ncbi:MerR family transcriptional regulator [Pseudalkalibacillus sp. NRS-1564]|uniref:MerR family transcriptional regulator n=1 Tax=Pseudalkalibacillus sp. NRS-1564 TaxID=3233900 RepID=UPI003D290A20
MDHKFTIGQMSKLHDIPVKTLRYYDEIGLFKPFQVDNQTGYRYYCLEQFKKLDMIWYLKKMGIPLKEIKKKVEHSTVDEFIEILSEYERINDEKINELVKMKKHLKTKILDLKQSRDIHFIGEPQIRTLPHRYLLAIQGLFHTLDDIESVLRGLKKEIDHVTPIMVGKVGFILSVDHMKTRETMEYDGLFILIEDDSEIDQQKIMTLEEGEYASVYMREGREKDNAYYHTLLNFVSEQGYEPDGPFFIRQIVDSFISHKENERLREIQIKVRAVGEKKSFLK